MGLVNEFSDLLVTMDFQLPSELEAIAPPEMRGRGRDDVRLMVSQYNDDRVIHTDFPHLSDHLLAGDVLVINTSGTRQAALHAVRTDGSVLRLHLSTHLPDGRWVVELRQVDSEKNVPFLDARSGDVVLLPAGSQARLIAAYQNHYAKGGVRLWAAELEIAKHEIETYLSFFGTPIQYGYARQPYPISAYQTVYHTEIGSAEMPSAGRAFTPALITSLVAKGVQVAPLILHTGVASLEADEAPYAEYYRVPQPTADLVNTARQKGRRVIAVGTTSVRALETLTSEGGYVESGEGWTELVITPERGIYAVDGMLTGFHEPRASHLAMLQALAGCHHLELTYQSALDHRYLWHEFGDLHLILP
jgi:S-adenosylmethionine:tRNA ribosyltransferase-isomerase